MSFASLEWRGVAAEFLSGSKTAFATTLVAIVVKSYGAEALNWDPLTRRTQISEDFKVELGRREFEALEGLINAMTTDTVYRAVPVFLKTVDALNHRPDDGEVPDADDVAWAVAEISANDPNPEIPMQNGIPWSSDIRRTVGVVLDSEGILGEPQILKWAIRKNPPAAEGKNDTVESFEDAMASAASKADEIDDDVDRRFEALIKQLELIGVHPKKLDPKGPRTQR